MSRHTDRSWRRWIRICVIALCVGVVINVLVAWGVAAAGLPMKADHNYDAPGQGWPRRSPVGWPTEPDTWMTGESLGYASRGASHNMAALARTRRTDPTVVMHMMIVDAYGLPFRSMRTTRRIVQRGPAITSNEQTVLDAGTIVPRVLNPSQTATNRFAFDPVWPGFVLNSLVYAVLALVTMLGLTRLRADRRRRRGRCVRCNYLLAGLDVCPECGATP